MLHISKRDIIQYINSKGDFDDNVYTYMAMACAVINNERQARELLGNEFVDSYNPVYTHTSSVVMSFIQNQLSDENKEYYFSWLGLTKVMNLL